jgi:hypothetical protein
MPSKKRTALLMIITLPLALGILTPLVANANPVKSQISTKQIGADLSASWTFGKNKPTKQIITIKEAGKIILTKNLPSKSRTYIFKGLVADKKYSLILTSNNPKITLSSSIILIAAPKTPQQLTSQRLGERASITWAETINNVDTYEISALGSNGEVIQKIISAPLSTFTFENLSPKVSYTITIKAKNIAGYSAAATTRLIYEDVSLNSALNNRIIDPIFAEKVIGPGALTMRPAAGPVDLGDPAQASQNLVMSLLHNCLTTSADKKVSEATLPNLGALFALRSTKDTILLTSGAMGIENVDGAQWISDNNTIQSCITNPLTTQLHNVATALSPQSTVSKTSVENLPTTINGRKSAIATGSVKLGSGDLGSVEQPLQILWVGVGSGNYLSQYILIRFGANIDNNLINALNSAISQAITS